MPHIPTAETGTLDLLTFADAMRLCGEGEKSYDPERWLYVPDFYTEYRYILGTKGKNPLIAVGINPSTAAPDNLDNTLKSVERIALAGGYDSFIMFNVYAQRATDPKHMEKTFNEALHRENMAAFEYVLSLSEHPSVWAAWGTIIRMRPYLRDCMRDMVTLGEKYGAAWYTCGARSKVGGHPHHPLYLRKDAVLEPFDPAEYLASPEW
ncbi:MAG: DUF1643 domain-containing protein [Clostridia bacterium]|nr:DUF1643 domain-containing protein [Oscillospiraceae bacterium]MBO5128393.1 DUF1643 domain-containing protein [Clostridia bacterium]MBO5256974.1 DUF1643 domain-containing protein [Clostridia bacterium]